jgi:hypothetical protein
VKGAFIVGVPLFGVIRADGFLGLQRQARGPVRQRQHFAPQECFRLFGTRFVDLDDDFIMRRHADRHERERRVGFDSGYRQAQEVGGDSLRAVFRQGAVPEPRPTAGALERQLGALFTSRIAILV